MYWPVRMCQPVSPSPSSDIQPLAPDRNIQTISAIKKQSESDGVNTRPIPRPAAARKAPLSEDAGFCAMDSAGEGGCVEVAKVPPFVRDARVP